MAERERLDFSDGGFTVHFVGPMQKDVALCGHDLAGDSSQWAIGGGYAHGIPTNRKANCEDCIKIVEFVKGIQETEYNNKRSD